MKNRILVATSSSHHTRAIREALQGEHRLVFFSDEAALMDDLRDGPVTDLVLLGDFPELDGYELCRRIVQENRSAEIPVIFLCPPGETNGRSKTYEAGGADYLAAPLDATEIRERVRTHLDASAKRRISQRHREALDLLHVLSHDLSNSLSVVVWALDLLDVDIGRYDGLAGTMRGAADKAFGLIEAAQQLRSAEEKPVELESVNLKLAIDGALDTVRDRFLEKEISVAAEIADDLVVIAENDSLVNSVLRNVFSNAVNFSDVGSRVHVTAGHRHGQIAVAIRDQGVGIPADQLKQVLEVTRIAGRSGTRGERGHGLGMPQAIRFVEAYGGDIEIESVSVEESPEEHGTTVTIRLLPGTPADR